MPQAYIIAQQCDIISKIYHPFREERISLKTPSLYNNEGVFMAETEGFEPSCRCRQTDFESAPLWPLRYVSICLAIISAPSRKIKEKVREAFRLPVIISSLVPKSAAFVLGLPGSSPVCEGEGNLCNPCIRSRYKYTFLRIYHPRHTVGNSRTGS